MANSDNTKQGGKGSQGSEQENKARDQGSKQSDTSNRGFASMDPERQREIASEGGRAAHQAGTAHEFTSAEAREAGKMSHKNDNAQQSSSSGSSSKATPGSSQSGKGGSEQGGGGNQSGNQSGSGNQGGRK
jgi:hypothetical protein